MSGPSCRDVRADLSAYLEGELDAVPAGEIRAHLESCAACRSELELQRLTVGALRRLPELLPPTAILAGVRGRLRPDPWYRRLIDGRQWLLGFPVGALATLFVVVGIALFQAHYPDLPQTLTQSPALSPAPEMPAQPTAIAPPVPGARDLDADREAAPRPALPVRRDRRAKGGLDSANLPQTASPAKTVAAPESSTITGADKSDRFRAVAPAPVEPAAPTGLAAVESKAEQRQAAQSEPPVAAATDELRKESPRVEKPAAAPSSGVVLKAGPATERTAVVAEYAAGNSRRADASLKRAGAVVHELEETDRVIAPAALKKKEAAAFSSREADSGADLGRAESAGKKQTSSTRIRVVCLLAPETDSVENLTRLLRDEGAADIAVDALEPRAVRAAFAPHRGRLGRLPEPTRGWSVTASVAPRDLARLVDALTNRTSLRILEQPAAPPADRNLLEEHNFHITVLQ